MGPANRNVAAQSNDSPRIGELYVVRSGPNAKPNPTKRVSKNAGSDITANQFRNAPQVHLVVQSPDGGFALSLGGLSCGAYGFIGFNY